MDRNFNSSNEPALWGGIECTINRVRNEYRDQLQLTGHYDRPDDILHFSRLGIAKMRYPVLWERHAPVKDQQIDWDFTARSLGHLQDLDITPIAGLVHHGSGPAFTNLMDPDFAYYLADYAFAVANRFHFLKEFTPVNEPLTTARFSGLYGLWYPHQSDDRAFAQMLLNQLKGIVLSMQAVRAVNPDATLVQTEDLGKTHSSPGLAYQANFENERRWLTYDILCGRLQPGHALWSWFTEALRMNESDLSFFLDYPCPPEVLGLNYYVTSERWLDETLDNHPGSSHGGNQFQPYADVEVVRARPDLRFGLRRLGEEVWNRYEIPLAVTEVHLHCTREEQIRWFSEVWKEACGLVDRGIPVKGVTIWSLIGAYDWDSLLTKSYNHYEPGAFIAGEKMIRPTALAKLVQLIGRSSENPHPLLKVKGWWHGPQPLNNSDFSSVLLISGADDEIGIMLGEVCRLRGIPAILDIDPISDNWKQSSTDARFWEVIRYAQDNVLRFYTIKMECVANLNAPIREVLHQLLDLVIDGVEGVWSLDGIGTPGPPSTTREIPRVSLRNY